MSVSPVPDMVMEVAEQLCMDTGTEAASFALRLQGFQPGGTSPPCSDVVIFGNGIWV